MKKTNKYVNFNESQNTDSMMPPIQPQGWLNVYLNISG